MYSRPSSSVTRAPRPWRMKSGVPPTARKARTGELTPPGMTCCERSNSARLRSYMRTCPGGILEESRERQRGCAHIGSAEQGVDHRHHVSARLDGKRSVVDIDAADGDQRQAGNPFRLREIIKRRARGIGLGGGSKDAADRDVVGPGIARGQRPE